VQKGISSKNLSLVPKTPRQAFHEPTTSPRKVHTNGQQPCLRRVLIVCSPGGHLQQMLALDHAWSDLERTWVTLPAPDVEHLLAREDVITAYGPTNRNIINLLRNLPLAWRVVRQKRPDVILSTGAALAVPFFVVGRLLRRRLVYVESLTRIESVSLSGRLVYPLADEFFVQWPQAVRRSRMRYEGSVL
jgi:beta-1,4-N-acetylglucosaminyltransferase